MPCPALHRLFLQFEHSRAHMQAPLPIPPITLHEAKRNISVRHLEQLANLSFTRDNRPPEEAPEREIPYGLFGSSSPYEDLLEWSKENAS
ncbi:unnamed protein product [Rhizoctonia solani]|uniref:Uncharacterized protein n=1 Tax=Rhizoctonia solani TaxID=456999 RepID=A0A8H3CZY0_9AGAM|nr:unnamed protein product [Rhizoctonia solani]